MEWPDQVGFVRDVVGGVRAGNWQASARGSSNDTSIWDETLADNNDIPFLTTTTHAQTEHFPFPSTHTLLVVLRIEVKSTTVSLSSLSAVVNPGRYRAKACR